MANTNFLIEAQHNTPSNVIQLWPAEGAPRTRSTRPGRARAAQVHAIDVNLVESEAPELRLARRVERVLCALLYHTQLEPAIARASQPGCIEERVGRLVSRDRLTAIAHAAITLGSTADLTRLAAIAITFELQTQSSWRQRLLCLFSARLRQIKADMLAIAGLLAWDLAELKLRPIDQFAQLI